MDKILSQKERELCVYLGEVEDLEEKFELWDETQSKSREIMTWCNESVEERANIHLITAPTSNDATTTTLATNTKTTTADQPRSTITCPSCGHHIEFQDQVLICYFLF